MNTDYDDVLRQALHAAAESIEPAGDGLERIRARIRPVPLLSLATAAAWCSGVSVRLVSWAEPAVAAAIDFFWAAVDRFRPGQGPEHARVRYGWLRPVAAMGTAIFVVAAGAFAVMTLPGAISSSPIALPWSSHDGSSQTAGTSGLAGSGSPLPSGAVSSGAPGGVLPGNPTATATCRPSGGTGTKSPSPSSSPSSGPATTPPSTTSPPTTTTPPTSTSPTDTPTSPSTSDSTTPDPGSAGTPTPSVQTPAAGASGQGGTMAQAAFVVPSKSQAPPPCGSKEKTSKPSASSSGPSALDPPQHTLGAGQRGSA